MNPSLLAAGCETQPGSPKLQYRPPASTAYKVKGADDWWKLAALPQVKAAGLSALDLCVYNFQTRNPAEINWYLRNKVGCTQTTADKKNYRFSDDASPGIVYLPAATGGVVDVGETVIVGTLPGTETGGASAAEEFSWETPESRLITVGWFIFKVKIVIKGKVEWGNASPDFKAKLAANLTKREYAAGVEAKLSQDWSIGVQAKISEKDLTDPSELRKKLSQSLEGTVKRKLNIFGLKPQIEFGLKVPKDGLFMVAKATTPDAPLPLSPFVELLGMAPVGFNTKVTGTVQFSFSIGFSPSGLATIARVAATPAVAGGGALIGLAAWVAFCGKGIQYTYEKSDQMAFYSYYVTGYVEEVLPVGGLYLPPRAEDRAKAEQFIRDGRQDAQATARAEFGNMKMHPMEAYRIELMSRFDGSDFEAKSAARKFLRALIVAKLAAEKGIKTV